MRSERRTAPLLLRTSRGKNFHTGEVRRALLSNVLLRQTLFFLLPSPAFFAVYEMEAMVIMTFKKRLPCSAAGTLPTWSRTASLLRNPYVIRPPIHLRRRHFLRLRNEEGSPNAFHSPMSLTRKGLLQRSMSTLNDGGNRGDGNRKIRTGANRNERDVGANG